MKNIKKIGISLAVAIALNFSGCGDNNTQNENSPAVTYGGDTEGNNDLSRYTNADWLYQNYFGEYGLPNELKSMMLPELQMMANGFALQHAKGEDVQKSISQLNTAMNTLYYSGKLNLMVHSMQDEYQEGLYNPSDTNQTSTNDENITREITAEAQANIQESIKREEQYKREQEELVKNYNLPYNLPNKATKTITYSSAMKGGGGKNNPTSPNEPARPLFSGLDNWSWWDADFFWVDGAGGIGHMGFIDANDYGEDTVIDSMPGDGVQRHRGITRYMNKPSNDGWTRVEAWYYRGYGEYAWERQNIIGWAYGKVGTTGYGLLVGKSNRNETYCSGLIWQGFSNMGVNLDSDGGWYVWPRDITNHSSVLMFSSQNR